MLPSLLKQLIPLIVIIVLLSACKQEKPQTGIISAYNLEVDRSLLGKRLSIFIYPDYLEPQLVKRFEEVYGVDILIDYYENNETMLAKLQAGGIGQYDLIVPTDYAVPVMVSQGLLQPLEKKNIPNLNNLDPRFLNLPFDPGNEYSVCYQWGTMGFGIRTDLVDLSDKDYRTWKVVFDPAYQLGPFVMQDAQRETIAAALIYLGYSVNTTDEAQLKEAEELLIAQRKRVLAYVGTSTCKELLVSGDAVVGHNYNGDILMAQNELSAIKYVIPREGSIIWTDNIAVPKGAPNKYTAEVFINFILDAENGGILTNYTMYASPNKASRPYIKPEIRENPDAFPPDELLDKLQFIVDLGQDTRLYDRMWTRIKAAGN